MLATWLVECVDSPARATVVDVWSIGCILAELYLRRPLFEGQNRATAVVVVVVRRANSNNVDIDQVTRTFAIMGTPSEDALARLSRQLKKKKNLLFFFKENTHQPLAVTTPGGLCVD